MSNREGPVVRVAAPASLSNLGPGFDAFGLCVEGIADEVAATRVSQPGVRVLSVTGLSESIPCDETNTAAVGAQLVLERSGDGGGIELDVVKGIRIGSGIGGSAASAVAGAVAANEVLGRPLSNEEVLDAGLEAEKSAAGAIHGDNVLPCMFGGFVLTTPKSPEVYRRYDIGRGLSIALLLPKFTVLTEEARGVLPPVVPLFDAATTAAAAAHVLASLLDEDWSAFGAAIMKDRLVEPHRAKLAPFYDTVRASAMAAGALGCALSGSGPAMFAVTNSEIVCNLIVNEMLRALRSEGYDGVGRVTHADNTGVRILSSD